MPEWLIGLLDRLIILIWVAGMVKTYIETAPDPKKTWRPGEVRPRLGWIHETK